MAAWVIVVDDDAMNLQMAGRILSHNNMRVTALKSGRALLEYLKKNGTPDIILLDIKMPEMDGFETLSAVRSWEKSEGREETPVVFLTADEDSETERHGFEAGVADYVRKPFVPEVLLKRIRNIVSKEEKMHTLMTEAATDGLTGMLNKMAAGNELSRMCATRAGSLMMIDLDAFKLINDIYGHDAGDKILVGFSALLKGLLPTGSICGRLGGDEFAAFCVEMRREEEIKELSEKLNQGIIAHAKGILGVEMNIPLGVSIGAVRVPDNGNDYDSLMKLADTALYYVKQNGKHGYSIYSAERFEENTGTYEDINTISTILGERAIPNHALQLDKESFANVYRYVMRYIVRNRRSACKVMFTLSPGEGTADETYHRKCDEFGNHIRESLRKSDVFMRNRSNTYFVFLTDIKQDAIEKVVGNILEGWHKKNGDIIFVEYETAFVKNDDRAEVAVGSQKLIVVDDDPANRKIAARILGNAGFDVETLESGSSLLDYLERNRPELILLDVKMPVLDGFETMKRLKTLRREISDIPVIFLTADENEDSERMGLSLGAMDFIKKPFVPEVLLLRVKHILELITLQRSLGEEVERKTQENKKLMIDVVEALAAAIDAKDTYTNGHSHRVAEYSKEIAKRAGYSIAQQNEIYMMGLLHDVGKIGIPDAVINKPGRLNDEEYAIIKTHPVMGAKILENIEGKQRLAIGAKWHHERFDGKGYPDGLAGAAIPEEARILSVADAYDAMTSKRSYRDVLSQEYVRNEIEKGRGTQFDPEFAAIMLGMIDEDKDYNMREK